eukprot:5857404-Pyramimonas_sp.AAC.2
MGAAIFAERAASSKRSSKLPLLYSVDRLSPSRAALLTFASRTFCARASEQVRPLIGLGGASDDIDRKILSREAPPGGGGAGARRRGLPSPGGGGPGGRAAGGGGAGGGGGAESGGDGASDHPLLRPRPGLHPGGAQPGLGAQRRRRLAALWAPGEWPLGALTEVGSTLRALSATSSVRIRQRQYPLPVFAFRLSE